MHFVTVIGCGQMRFESFRLVLIGALLAVVSASSSASPIWGRCHGGCLDAPAMASAYPEGDHVIYGTTTAYAFTNRLEMQGENCHINGLAPGDSAAKSAAERQRVGCTQVMVTTPRALEAWEVEGVKDLQLYNIVAKDIIRIEGTAEDLASGPVGNGPAAFGGPNAYDYKNNAIFRASVDDFARQAISDELDDLVAILEAQRAGLWGRVKSLVRDIVTKDVKSPVISVVFPDKSYVILEFRLDADLVAIPLAIKDSEKREIMTRSNVEEFAGEVTFPNGGENSLQNWLENARQRGVPIIVGGGGSGALRSVSCSWDGETLTCHDN